MYKGTGNLKGPNARWDLTSEAVWRPQCPQRPTKLHLNVTNAYCCAKHYGLKFIAFVVNVSYPASHAYCRVRLKTTTDYTKKTLEDETD